MRIINRDIAKEISRDLLEISAIKLKIQKPFKWSSGWNSPIYCDNRLSLSFPELRSRIKQYLCLGIQGYFKDVDLIAGVATAGIPQGAIVADELNLPFVYVRSKPKGHGMENLIEGKVEKGQKVVLIEDLISTGGSSLKAAEALRAAGCQVLGIGAIFTYGFEAAEENFRNADVAAFCLSDYHELIDQAIAMDYVKETEKISLESWRESPSTWNT
ncbi:MAG: orotate phosphoribosyltransferase [Cyclobacteriaceae bacterium]